MDNLKVKIQIISYNFLYLVFDSTIFILKRLFV